MCVCVWCGSETKEKQRDKSLTLVFLFNCLCFSPLSLLYQHCAMAHTHTHNSLLSKRQDIDLEYACFCSSCFPASLWPLFFFVVRGCINWFINGTSFVPSSSSSSLLFSPLLFFLNYTLSPDVLSWEIEKRCWFLLLLLTLENDIYWLYPIFSLILLLFVGKGRGGGSLSHSVVLHNPDHKLLYSSGRGE